MRSRVVLREIARVVLAVMFFAQAALAGAACTMPERSPARAIAGTESAPCHQSDPQERNANLCLADCLSTDQSTDTPQLPAIAPNPAPVLLIAVVEIVVPRFALRGRWLAAAADPPLRILFQTFQI